MKRILLSLIIAFSCSAYVFAEKDPTKIVTPNECGKCHNSELRVWKNTHHFKTFDELHKRDQAKNIMKKMGISGSLKQKEVICWQCHYTIQAVDGKNKPATGISCESCHGAGKDWKDIHNDLTTPLAEREKKVDALGMIRPDRIYYVAENCYQCHTIPNEKLVNVGGHPASSDFNLVAWSQGEIRHNFQRGKGKNAEAPKEKKRVLLIMGEVMELQYGLIALADAKDEKGKYFTSMKAKINGSYNNIKKIYEVTKLPELKEMLDAVKVKLSANNQKALLETAEKIKATAIKFSEKYKGTEAGLDKVDSMMPKQYKGKTTE